MSRHSPSISGHLMFSPRRVLLQSGEKSYFVRQYSLRDGYVHGDSIRARIVRQSDGEKLPEVEVISLLRRSEEILLATITETRDKRYLEIRKEQGMFRTALPQDARHHALGDIVACKFLRDGNLKVLHRFAQEGDYDIEERLIFFLSGAHTEFSHEILAYAEKLESPRLENNDTYHPEGISFAGTNEKGAINPRVLDIEGSSHSSHMSHGLHRILALGSMDRITDAPTPASTEGQKFVTKLHPEKPLFAPLGDRIDFRNWYTLTIDGADAKDLDDAISLAEYPDGRILLGVHIADVAEYVQEGSPLDREALSRATSIYTPGRVIPMLPEKLSNDLCSLHPGSPKLTLSCLMVLDQAGQVKQTEVVEGIIESQKKGVYEEVYESMKYEVGSLKNNHLDKGEQGDLFLDAKNVTLFLASRLYEILTKRRQKEGKIIFESTEISFEFENPSFHNKTEESLLDSSYEDTSISNSKVKNKGIPMGGQKLIPTGLHKRDRNDAHMMIEEFMVLANEEIAKWCVHHELPFLSRVHGIPGSDNLRFIATIIENQEIRRKLEPHHIRSFMEQITDPIERFRFSRLLLPKMAKAKYADTPSGHFGLALSHYSHFTSPIRRYPDLQVHRIIKEALHGGLSPERKSHYRSILRRVARHSSDQERTAEDIERTFDALYACRYMQDKVGQTFVGKISGIAEFALFIELENGIEGTLYLPRRKYRVNVFSGSLETFAGKELHRIGEDIVVQVTEVDMSEKRIILTQK